MWHVEVREQCVCILSFQHVSSGDRTWVIRLGGRPLPLYQLSHLTRPPQFKIKIFNIKVSLNISFSVRSICLKISILPLLYSGGA